MIEIIVATSGRGGVGKTTTSAAFSTGLVLRDRKAAVIDFDVGLRNLDLIMGCECCVVYDLTSMIHGEANLNQALIRDKKCENLFILPASQTRGKDTLTRKGVEKVIEGLKEMGFEYIVYDSPADIESDALIAVCFTDKAIVVTNPEVSSVRNSDRILNILSSKSRRTVKGKEPVEEHLLLMRYSPRRVSEDEILSLTDIQEILRIRLVGVIPESGAMLRASNQGLPAIHPEGSDVANAYHDVIDRFLDKEKELRYAEYNKPGFLQHLFGGGR